MASTSVSDAPSKSQRDFLLSKALASASSLVFLQLFSRIFTFVLNQALVRLVSPDVFGTAAIQFELLLSTILFLSREGVRSALLRASDKSALDKTKNNVLVTNISVLPVTVGVPAAVLIALLYIGTTSASTASQPHFRGSVAIYTLAASLELLSEPLYIRAQNELRFDLRVKAEGTAVVARTLVVFTLLVTLPVEWALVAFAAGQTAYGLTVLVTYLRAYKQGISFWPRKTTALVHGKVGSQYFDPSLLHLSAAMTGQSLVKHFLTEGDKFLISRLSPLADQGGYAIASNYGSLVARIVFQPVEETSRVFFAKTLSTADSRESLKAAANMLMNVLLVFTHLLLLLVTFGPPYMALAVSILLPPRYHYTSAPTILRTYVYYIPMMAFNGILEAFFASASAPSDLHAQSRWMFVFSVGFVVAAVGLAKGAGVGDAGLVWANVANLLCRAIYAWLFVRRYFRARGGPELASWKKAVPPGFVLATFAASAAVTRYSEWKYRDVPLQLLLQRGHVAMGLCCLAGCMSACLISERAALLQINSFLRRR